MTTILKRDKKIFWAIIQKVLPYNANRSRWKSFADACVNLNSLENFRGVNVQCSRAQLQYVRQLLSSVVVLRVLVDTIQIRTHSSYIKGNSRANPKDRLLHTS